METPAPLVQVSTTYDAQMPRPVFTVHVDATQSSLSSMFDSAMTLTNLTTVYTRLPEAARPPELGADRERLFSALWNHVLPIIHRLGIRMMDVHSLLQLIPDAWEIREGDLTISSPMCIVYRLEEYGIVTAAFDVVREEGISLLECRACGDRFAGLHAAESHALRGATTEELDRDDSDDVGERMMIDAIEMSLNSVARQINNALLG